MEKHLSPTESEPIQADSALTLEMKNIEKIRAAMREQGVTHYYFSCSDPHYSEIVDDHYNVRLWLSHFTGSAGQIVISLNQACLWVDGRYHLQADQQVSQYWSVFKLGQDHVPSIWEWIEQKSQQNFMHLGFDPLLVNYQDYQMIQKIQGKNPEQFHFSQLSLLHLIWTERPAVALDSIFQHKKPYFGQTSAEKIKEIYQLMLEKNYSVFFIHQLDVIAWILNWRSYQLGHDLVFYAYMIIQEHTEGPIAHLFIDQSEAKLLVEHFPFPIQVHPYDSALEFVYGLQSLVVALGLSINVAFYEAFQKNNIVVFTDDLEKMKAQKAPQIIQYWSSEAMVQDALVLLKTCYWIKHHYRIKSITEYDVVQRLKKHYAENPLFLDVSFDPLVGFADNAQQPHYWVQKDSAATISDGLLLIDTGAHYHNGTSDITRMLELGIPTPEMRTHYTIVLKAHLAVLGSIFPAQTSAKVIDSIARAQLWKHQMDFAHGTGHGVGYAMMVHEPPKALTPTNADPLVLGQVISNEPGFYHGQHYGIRIENLMQVQMYEENQFGQFYHFKNLTLYPYNVQLMDESLLLPEEKMKINTYHREIYDRLIGHLQKLEDQKYGQYLAEITRPI